MMRSTCYSNGVKISDEVINGWIEDIRSGFGSVIASGDSMVIKSDVVEFQGREQFYIATSDGYFSLKIPPGVAAAFCRKDCMKGLVCEFEDGRFVVKVERSDRGKCLWSNDEHHDKWDTKCGTAFQFTADGIVENEYKFCPKCGKEIEAQR